MGIYNKWAELLERVGYVQKTGNNAHFKYTYVTEADMIEALRPVMSELGLLFYPSKSEVVPNSVTGSASTVITIKYTYTLLDSETGESVDMEVIAQGADSQDKGAYKAATGARKYALRQLILVSTGDDPEKDEDTDGVGVANQNAIAVLRKYREADIFSFARLESDPVYIRLAGIVGVSIKKIPSTDRGNVALRKLFDLAVAVKNKNGTVDELIDEDGEQAKTLLRDVE